MRLNPNRTKLSAGEAVRPRALSPQAWACERNVDMKAERSINTGVVGLRATIIEAVSIADIVGLTAPINVK